MVIKPGSVNSVGRYHILVENDLQISIKLFSLGKHDVL